jgi:glycosyltransferase involved in cell wall biosynthesis
MKKIKNKEDRVMKVSLVMGVYNGERFLNETLDSILAQTYSNLEIIIVDDGSTDSTAEILNSIKDERLRIIHLDKNRGVANALNVAISQAKGDWISWRCKS